MSFGMIRELIVGQSQSGKSIYLRHRLLECERAVFWDPTECWSGRSFRNLDHLEAVMTKRPWWRFAFVPDGADRIEQAAEFCELAQSVGRCHVFIDEGDTFAPNSTKLDPRLENFILRSRHDRVSWSVVTQRPALLNKTFVSQANRAAIFRTVDPDDIALLRKRFGSSVDAAPGLAEGAHVRIDF